MRAELLRVFCVPDSQIPVSKFQAEPSVKLLKECSKMFWEGGSGPNQKVTKQRKIYLLDLSTFGLNILRLLRRRGRKH